MDSSFYAQAALRYHNSYRHQTVLGNVMSWLSLAIFAGCVIVIAKLPKDKQKQYGMKITAVMLLAVVLFALSYIFDALDSF